MPDETPINPMTPAAPLQVEQMPESDDLKARRNQMHGKIAESGALQPAEPLPAEELFDEEEGGLRDLLAEAKLSPKHLRFCCGVVFVFVLIGGLVFGGIKFLDFLNSRPDKIPTETEEVVTEPVEDVSNSVDLDPTLEGSLLVGEETTTTDGSTAFLEDLGETNGAVDSFTEKALDFIALYQAMKVDVNELLDGSKDRAEALDDYKDQLTQLYRLGQENQEKLISENEDLADEYTEVELVKDSYEEAFFEQLQNLNAKSADVALSHFVERAQEVVALRAEYRARQKLVEYYELVLPLAELRLKDMELNEEALLKDVQVVEVEGSDINLILQENEL